MSNGDLFWAVLQLAVSLPLVAGLAYLAVRYGLGRRLTVNRGRHMRVIEQIPLGPKAALTLVQVGRRYYLLAQQDSSVTLLQEFDQLPEVLPFPGMPTGDGLRAPSFRQDLSLAINRLKERFTGEKPAVPDNVNKCFFNFLNFFNRPKSNLDGQKDEDTAEKK
ncbi:flagellar biosynthetic protein FliO [Desulfofundulus sp.]|uniref:flagellar biosynthetic protein FliO n=1 Tax=Desulfofundulus sp. TaxID=2282750 RepID=UPI003C74E7FB